MKQLLTKISHPLDVKIKKVDTEGTFNLSNGKITDFCCEKEDEGISSIILEMDPDTCFNYIEIVPGSNIIFPENFRIEFSDDKLVWEPLLQETGFSNSGKKTGRWHFPLTSSTFVKLVARLGKSEKKMTFKCLSIRIFIS